MHNANRHSRSLDNPRCSTEAGFNKDGNGSKAGLLSQAILAVYQIFQLKFFTVEICHSVLGHNILLFFFCLFVFTLI